MIKMSRQFIVCDFNKFMNLKLNRYRDIIVDNSRNMLKSHPETLQYLYGDNRTLKILEEFGELAEILYIYKYNLLNKKENYKTNLLTKENILCELGDIVAATMVCNKSSISNSKLVDYDFTDEISSLILDKASLNLNGIQYSYDIEMLENITSYMVTIINKIMLTILSTCNIDSDIIKLNNIDITRDLTFLLTFSAFVFDITDEEIEKAVRDKVNKFEEKVIIDCIVNIHKYSNR